MDGGAAVDPLAGKLDEAAATRVAVGARGVKGGVDLALAESDEKMLRSAQSYPVDLARLLVERGAGESRAEHGAERDGVGVVAAEDERVLGLARLRISSCRRQGTGANKQQTMDQQCADLRLFDACASGWYSRC